MGLQKWVQWRPLSTDVLAFQQFQQTFLFGYQVVNQPAESVGCRFCMFKLFYVCMLRVFYSPVLLVLYFNVFMDFTG